MLSSPWIVGFDCYYCNCTAEGERNDKEGHQIVNDLRVIDGMVKGGGG